MQECHATYSNQQLDSLHIGRCRWQQEVWTLFKIQKSDILYGHIIKHNTTTSFSPGSMTLHNERYKNTRQSSHHLFIHWVLMSGVNIMSEDQPVLEFKVPIPLLGSNKSNIDISADIHTFLQGSVSCGCQIQWNIHVLQLIEQIPYSQNKHTAELTFCVQREHEVLNTDLQLNVTTQQVYSRLMYWSTLAKYILEKKVLWVWSCRHFTSFCQTSVSWK